MFWVIYKNLEKEIIELSNKLHFCDKQEKVYSIYISDLLIRISVEIEALSKELYKNAGGNMRLLDDEGNERDLMFDSDCIQFLDINWGITKKRVNVVCPNFYFTKTENLELQPLKDCNKHGQGRWKKAYQAVKHDRVNSLDAGNVGNMIRALAALYILNIYYRNEKYEIGTMLNTNPFDTRMGSDIFSLLLVRADKYNFNNGQFTEASDDDFKSATLVQKFTDEAYEELKASLHQFESDAKDKIAASPKAAEFFRLNPDYKFKGYLAFAKDVGGDELVREIIRDQKIVGDINNAKIEVVLNKGQLIYPQTT